MRYVITGVVRRYLPEPVLFAIMRMRGDGNGAESNPAHIAADWKQHLDRHGITLTGRHVLELGSGRYARLALQLLAMGACRVTLVDFYAVPLTEPAHYRMLIDDCIQLGLNPTDALACIEVISGDFLTLPLPPPSQRPDLITSLAVLEHVYDPGAILKRCYEWLADDGETFHIVDLRDHNLQFRYPFEMLTFSDKIWERWLNQRGGFYLNRWRAPDYQAALVNAGFTEARCISTLCDPQGLAEVQARMDRRFRSYSTAQLAIQGVTLIGTRPALDIIKGS